MALALLLDGAVALLPATAHGDERGTLTSLEFGPADFAAVRSFVVRARDGAVRGGHAHLRGRQIMICLSGSIEVELREGGNVEHVTLEPGGQALLKEPRVWARQTYRGEAPCLLVLCDTPYDPSDHVDQR